MLRRDLVVIVSVIALSGCPGAPGPEYSAEEGRTGSGGSQGEETIDGEAVPHGRLPSDVTPSRYRLWLEVVPSRERFEGRVEIEIVLERPRDVIWLHGAGLQVSDVEVLVGDQEPISARYEQVDEEGVAVLRLESPVGPGPATLILNYDAPFDRQLKGLYRVDTDGESYAFTQFEATSARYCFPGFDEPRFKTPFEITLSVLPEHRAISNTAEVSRRTVSGMSEVRFLDTAALPTYLIAMAVGPLDVVEHAPIPANEVRDHPLPFRGVAARGRGARLAYALDHTAALLHDLETYFDIAYPYDKLDIIAVPDFASGAMENAGAITFRETLLLIDEANAPEEQRRWFAQVMAHELAHQWFGNLVTMPWWDDIWLNEAFATWMGNKVVQHVHPEYQGELGFVGSVDGAMYADSLVNARQIRQPIDTNHDIRNAFDSITYRKGGGVLAMFERWLGEDTFRDGIREYLASHTFGTATSGDLLDALGRNAGRDVGTPFRTFLDQPGVPLVSAERVCEGGVARVRLQQRRYFPVGSSGDPNATWQIPVCVRHGRGARAEETCTLLTEPEAMLELGSGPCPDWIMPNSAAAGYYRWSMPANEIDDLTRAYARLSPTERLSLGSALDAAFVAGLAEPRTLFDGYARIAADPSRQVATTPMGLLGWVRNHIVYGQDDLMPPFERYAAGLYTRRARELGWNARPNEDGERALMRSDVMSFLARVARDPNTRREAAARGRRFIGFEGDGQLHPEAVQSSLVDLALTTAVRESDAAYFDALLALALESDDALFRRSALGALSATHDPTLGDRALALALDPRVRVNEVTIPLGYQLGMPETRDRAFVWAREHFEEVFARVATTHVGNAPFFFASSCTEERATEVEAFLAPRIESLPGGPRNLRSALEEIRLCAARSASQREGVEAYFR